MVSEGHSFLPKILHLTDPTPLKKRRLPVDTRSASAVTPGENSLVITNKKSTMGFPVSLRCK